MSCRTTRVWTFEDVSEADLAIVDGDRCPEDTDGDGLVLIEDLLQVLADWGSCSSCAGDVTGDDIVDVEDLLAVIGAWGPC